MFCEGARTLGLAQPLADLQEPNSFLKIIRQYVTFSWGFNCNNYVWLKTVSGSTAGSVLNAGSKSNLVIFL